MRFLDKDNINEFADNVASFTEGEHAALEVLLIRREHVLAHILRTNRDTAMWRQVIGAIEGFLFQIYKTPADAARKAQCGCCDAEFSHDNPPSDFFFVRPAMAPWEACHQVLITGICGRCSQQDDDTMMAVADSLTKRLWPESQAVTGGNA